jgi:hypothetical protein
MAKFFRAYHANLSGLTVNLSQIELVDESRERTSLAGFQQGLHLLVARSITSATLATARSKP